MDDPVTGWVLAFDDDLLQHGSVAGPRSADWPSLCPEFVELAHQMFSFARRKRAWTECAGRGIAAVTHAGAAP